MNMKTFAVGAGLMLAAMTLSAKEPVPVMTKPGKELLSEDFSGTSLPAKWQPGGRPKPERFSLKE